MVDEDTLVSVIIPHYQDLHGLACCLAALEAQTFPRDRFEIIVADNDSKVGKAAVETVIARRASLVVNTEPGAGPTRNAGVSTARGNILAFIDSDCVPTTGWLAAGVAALASTDIVGGHVSVSVQNPAKMTGTEAYELLFSFDIAKYIKDKGFAGSGNLFVTLDIFERVGGFRASVSEDVDWCHRAVGMGYRLSYSRDAEVQHPARRTWPELRKKFARVNSELLSLAGDQRFGRLRWLARIWAMPASAVAHSLRIFGSKALPDTRSRLLALLVLYRIRFWRFADGNLKFLRGA